MPEITEEIIEHEEVVEDMEQVIETYSVPKENQAKVPVRKATHRCGKCNKSKHTACAGGDCQCLCRTHTVSKGRPEPERHYSAESNNHIEQVLAAYRAGKTPPEPVPDTKAE